MKLIGIVLLALALALLGLDAQASSCRHVAVVAPVVHHQNYNYGHHNYQPVLAATFVAVPLITPTYQVQYTGNDSQQLLQAVQQLKAEIQALKAPSVQAQQAPQVQQLQAGGLQSALGKCIACHDKNAAQAKGGGFVMFDGGATVKLTDLQGMEVLKQVRSGKMPKGAKLVAAEKDAISDWVAGVQ